MASSRIPVLRRTADVVSRLTWDALTPAVRDRLPLLVLDVVGCACAGVRLGAHRSFVATVVESGGPADAAVWRARARVPAAHAALLNGTVAHHVEMDDGNPRASVHGGVTIVPAAMAVAEAQGATGRECLAAIAGGYSAAVACGRALLPGITRHRLHPPGMLGAFDAAAARLLGLDADRFEHALALAGVLIPIAPFESFTKGAAVKDLYAGWPAFVGVTAALLAADGMTGPADLLEAPDDGLGSFLLHEGAIGGDPPDLDEPLHVQFKSAATCRSVQPALAALAALRPVDAAELDRILVETYPFAVGLSDDSDSLTPVGAKTSIPYCVASCLLDGEVMPEAFTPEALAQPFRRALAGRVSVLVAQDMVDPVVRGARVSVTLKSGERRSAEVSEPRWGAGGPASAAELRAKFRRLAASHADELQAAVDDLPAAPSLDALVGALQAGEP